MVDAAAALWWAIERDASFFIATGPRLAGKTSLARALLAFLPDDAAIYFTVGPGDPLVLLRYIWTSYIPDNCLINHNPVYLSESME